MQRWQFQVYNSIFLSIRWLIYYLDPNIKPKVKFLLWKIRIQSILLFLTTLNFGKASSKIIIEIKPDLWKNSSYESGRGRFAVATRDIPVGDLVCVERPCVSSILPEYMVTLFLLKHAKYLEPKLLMLRLQTALIALSQWRLPCLATRVPKSCIAVTNAGKRPSKKISALSYPNLTI